VRELWVIAERATEDLVVAGRVRAWPTAERSWDDDFHHALHTVLTGENSGYYVDFGRVAQLAKAFTDPMCTTGSSPSSASGRHGRPAEICRAPASSAACKPRQVGNRAFGERTAA